MSLSEKFGKRQSRNELLESALNYAEMGKPVFPCNPKTKSPLTTHGFKDASTDKNKIQAWWESSDSLIGIPTGSISGFVAIDIDTAEEHGKDGFAALDRLLDLHGKFPISAQAKSATGGMHILFAWDDTRPVRNGRGGLPPGIDVRGEGGYLIVAPSRKYDGRLYEWTNSLHEFDPAPMPGWLYELITSTPKNDTEKSVPIEVPPYETPILEDSKYTLSGININNDKFANLVMQQQFSLVSQTKSGARNSNLNKSAFILGKLVGSGLLDKNDVHRKLVQAAEECGLVADSAMNVLKTIESGLSAGIKASAKNQTPIISHGTRNNNPDKSVGYENNAANLVVELTHDSIAVEFARKHRQNLRYDHHKSAWYQWVGTHWKLDERKYALHLCRLLCREVTESVKPGDRGEVRKRAYATSVEGFASADPVFATLATDWDLDPWLLGTPGGTVDLRTGVLRPADPEEMITRVTSVAPHDEASCPVFFDFLDKITQGDKEYVRFLQQWGGYCLTGVTYEQAFCFAYGSGGNGKGTFIEVLTGILGPYAATAGMEVFVVSRSDRHSTELAMLNGPRLVTASETEQGRVLAESRIKLMTGGDLITARFMRKDNFTYKPQFKITIIGNFRPRLTNVDEAMARRLNLLPFEFTAKPKDLQLGDKLKDEWPGILRWLIMGCLDWQTNGLARPKRVQAASDDFLAEQDSIAEWLEAKCIVDHGNTYRTESTAVLYASFQSFCKEEGEPAGTKRTLAEALAKRGFKKINTVPAEDGRRVRGFCGIDLRPTRMQVYGE